MDRFHPLICDWFSERFGEPTPPQRDGWPSIADGKHTLIAAPTGSGKTLAAFLVSIDRLFRQWLNGQLKDRIDTIYVSPLRALSNDIDRNLQQPLDEIRQKAELAGLGTLPIRTALRTGDTTPSQRQAIIRRPPHLLVTTPESLYLLLTSQKGRERLTTVRTVIVDEIHALARDKRGSHLSLTLERLAHVCDDGLVRIGLSATQKPIDQIASFLVGVDTCRRDQLTEVGLADEGGDRSAEQDSESVIPMPAISAAGESDGVDSAADTKAACGDSNKLFPDPSCVLVPATIPNDPPALPCQIVDSGHVRQLDLAIEVPPSELSAVCTHEQWAEVYARLIELIETHRSTLIFVNTRRLAERVAHGLREMLGEEAVASHHGSLSKEIRLTAEQRLKNGELKAIVATASLELGIDIGLIDLVCQIGSTRSIATFLQRIGRSGHSLNTIPKGRLFPLTRDELLEAIGLIRAVRAQRLDAIEIPMQPLDILAQQIIAETSQEEWLEEELFERLRRAWPYRRLERGEFERIVAMVSEGVNPSNGRGAYVHRDRINGVLRARRGARIVAATSGGAIPETAEFRVVTEEERVVVGTVDEDFAIESTAGSVFLLGNNSWRVVGLRGGDMVVTDAHGMPPNIPFWFGEAPGRTVELSEEVSGIRHEIAERLKTASRIATPSDGAALADTTEENNTPASSPVGTLDDTDPLRFNELPEDVVQWVADEGGVCEFGAQQATLYVAAQVASVGMVPTGDSIVFERFFDETGGTQLVIHAPLGSRINRAWGLALRKRFCRSFDFELQAAADDNGVVLSLGPQHSLPIENLFSMLRPDNGQYLVEQAMLAVPFFQVRWRWNVTRALAVLRRMNGKKVPPNLQRFRSDDLLASAFPETVGCLENHHGDVEIPDHPLVTQTMRDCLFEATDIVRFRELLQGIESGEVELVARDTTEPSPFSHELLNANPYAFLDDAPLEERRSRAVATRRTLSTEQMRDLGQLDREALNTVKAQAWPLVRDADELHDALLSMVVLDEWQATDWHPLFEQLVAQRRATTVIVATASEQESSGWDEPEESPPPRRFWVASEQLPLIEAAYPKACYEPTIELPEALRREVSRSEARVALVRGAIATCGPTTVDELATHLCIEPSHIQSALEALEGEGVVMRGHYTDESAGRGTKVSEHGSPLQWCDRRLLARIHQLTLQGLRKQIRPVSADVYYRYLVDEHGLTARPQDEPTSAGVTALRGVIEKLQGFDLPAASWEAHVLVPRMSDYDPLWLDELFFAGEVVWGRLAPPRRKRKDGEEVQPTIRSALSRNVPVSLMIREQLGWLLPEGRQAPDPESPSDLSRLLEELKLGGAQFTQDLAIATGLPPSRVLEALSELAALGSVSGDSFATIRQVATRRGSSRPTRRSRNRSSGPSLPTSGRWSLFPPRVAEPTREQRLEGWCQLLLARYGVVFRELLTREFSAPRWYELQGCLRRMEMRGDIRGGRFIAGVGGEQFGTEAAVAKLREFRDRDPDDQAVVVGAADPLNLVGIIDTHSRLTASPKNALLLRNGTCVAVRNGVDVEFLVEEDAAQQREDRQQLMQFGLPQRAKEIRDRRLRMAQ